MVLGTGGLREKQNGIDSLSELLKCLTENYIRKKKEVVNKFRSKMNREWE